MYRVLLAILLVVLPTRAWSQTSPSCAQVPNLACAAGDTITGDFDFGDDIAVAFGDTGAGATFNWTVNFDDSVDDQLLWETTATGVGLVDTDPLFEILVDTGTSQGGSLDPGQYIFGIGKGPQADQNLLLALTDAGNLVIDGLLTAPSGVISVGTDDSGVYTFITGSGDTWTWYVENDDNNLYIQSNQSSSMVIEGVAGASASLRLLDGNLVIGSITAGNGLSTDDDGMLTIAGYGADNNENIRVNLDDTADTAVWTSGTGVNTWDILAANFTFGSGTGVNQTLTFKSDTSETLKWAETADRFELSDDLLVEQLISTGGVHIDNSQSLFLYEADPGVNYVLHTAPDSLATNSSFVWFDGGTTCDAGEVLEVASSVAGVVTLECDTDDSGGSTAWDDIGDPDNSGLKTITFDNLEATMMTTDMDNASNAFLRLRNTDIDLANTTTMLRIGFDDDAGSQGVFINCMSDDSGTPDSEFKVDLDGNVTAVGTVNAGDFTCTNCIDGDSITNTLAGDYLTLTAGSPDDIDLDPEAIERTNCMTIDDPETADYYLWFRAERALTVIGVDCISENATSTTIDVEECDGNGDTCGNIEGAMVCTTSNVSESGGLDDSAIDAGDWMRVDVTAKSGTPGHVAVCITYKPNDT